MGENACVGSRIPHVSLTTTDGGRFVYTDIWQRRQLLLVLLPPGDRAAWTGLEADLEGARRSLADLDTVLAISSDPVEGFPAPLALVADRWGEVTHGAELRIEDGRAMPGKGTLLMWVEATLHRCPECEGEAK